MFRTWTRASADRVTRSWTSPGRCWWWGDVQLRPQHPNARSQHPFETLEADPGKRPAFYLHLESVIARCMDEIFRLTESGEDDERQTKVVALKYPARLVLERFRKRDANWTINGSAEIAPHCEEIPRRQRAAPQTAVAAGTPSALCAD